jgi:hypothetical protein
MAGHSNRIARARRKEGAADAQQVRNRMFPTMPIEQ